MVRIQVNLAAMKISFLYLRKDKGPSVQTKPRKYNRHTFIDIWPAFLRTALKLLQCNLWSAQVTGASIHPALTVPGTVLSDLHVVSHPILPTTKSGKP